MRSRSQWEGWRGPGAGGRRASGERSPHAQGVLPAGRALAGRVARRISGARRVRGRPESPRFDLESTLDGADRALLRAVTPYTMTSGERLMATVDAVDYVVRRDVPGALVECGVWRGGSVLAMILRLQQLGVNDREFFLYDTFKGMTAPTDHDTSAFSESAVDTWSRAANTGRVAWDWLFTPELFGLPQVRDLLVGTGYPAERIHFVVGPVEETLPAAAPERAAILRLDTDWYASTRHELEHLYPRLSIGGVLIVDDYGHWEGCRKAVDEYFEAEAAQLLMTRVDYTGRVAIKH